MSSLTTTDPRGLRDSQFVSAVLVEKQPLDATVIEIDVDEVENQHSVVTLTVSTGTKSTDFDLLPGMRVEFDYGTTGNTKRFQGYIFVVTPRQRIVGTVNDSSQVITCYGPTLVFKGNQPRFFSDLTCTDMIRRIVYEGALGFNDEFRRDNTTWRALAQTDETDWQMITYLADRIGASVVNDRGVVRLIDYNDVMRRRQPSRYYNMIVNVPPPGYGTTPPNGTIIDFVPSNNTTLDPQYEPTDLAYLAGSGAVVQPAPVVAGARWQPQQFSSSMPVRTADEAAAIQQGLYIPEWEQEAEVRVIGDATVQVGSTVSCTNTRGSTVVTASYDGVWYVKEVHHQISGPRFYTTLLVGRSGSRPINTYQDLPYWLGDQRGVPNLRFSGDGRWISSWRGVTP